MSKKNAVALLGMGLLMAVGCASIPVLDQSAVRELAVEAIHVEGTDLFPLRPEDQWMADVLSKQATTALERAALEERLAGTLVRMPSTESARLTGELQMPAVLPPEIAGSRASFHEGSFVNLHLRLVDARGVELASANVDLSWKRVHWHTGGPKQKRIRRTDLVLIDAAVQAVEKGARSLAEQLAASASTQKAEPK